MYRNFGEDVEQESEHGKVDSYPLPTEPLPEVLRHRVDARGHVDGHKEPTEHQDGNDGLQCE
jgi:hypothetical protein